jgi:carboxymethylenebutenolidase
VTSPATWPDDPEHSLRVTTADGAFDAYVARPAGPDRPVLVVLQEVFGVNADMRATCGELAESGFIALCPDLFWRQQRGIDLSVRSQQDWETGLGLYKAYDIDAGVRDVQATVTAARSLRGASGSVGVVGFCLGGLLTYLMAARTQVDAAVAFHGGRTEEFLDEAEDIDAPLMLHLAEEDEFISKDAQRRIRVALAHNPMVEIFNYPGCRHAFARHDGAHYDAGAARLAGARTIAFFRRHLAE